MGIPRDVTNVGTWGYQSMRVEVEDEREDTGFPGAADEVLMIGSRQHQLSQLHA